MPSSSARYPLHGEHIDYLVRQARAMGVPSHEIDDLVQDTFVKAVELLPTFRGDAKVTTWLYKILLNVWRNGHRRIVRRNRKHHNFQMSWLAIERSQLESSKFEAERALAMRELRAFIDTLTPEAREAFLARAMNGLARKEAAQQLGVEAKVLDRRLGAANSRFDEQFEHHKRSARRATPIWVPIARWWTQSTVGGLLSVFSFVAIGLWLIAATTPKTNVQVREDIAAVPRRAASAPPVPLAEPEPQPRPILVDLPNVRVRAPKPAALPLDEQGRLALGRQLRYTGQPAAALEHIRQIDPSGPLARARWGNEVGILCELGRVDEAAAVAKQWLTQYPRDRPQLHRSCVPDE